MVIHDEDNRQNDIADRLVEVWKVLEALTVSLDRIGAYQAMNGVELGRTALAEFMNPAMFTRIATARTIIVGVIEGMEPSFSDKLDRLAEEATSIGYWVGKRQIEGG